MTKISKTIISIITVLLIGLPYTLQGVSQPANVSEYKIDNSIVSCDMNGILPISNFQIPSNFRKSGGKRGGGGPDSYGYTWLDSDTTGGPIYSWVEISGYGTRIEDYEWQSSGNPSDDGTAGPYSLGFSFYYEGTLFDEIYVGTNGVLSFTCDDLTYDGYFRDAPVPRLRFPNAVVPFWNDLNLDPATYGGGDVYYWTNNADSFVVEYYKVKPYDDSPTADTVTFEVILFGVDSSITFQYQTVDAYSNHAGHRLDSIASIGIQDQTTLLGLGYFNGNWGGPFENLPHTDLSVKFKKVMTHTHNIALGYFWPSGWPRDDFFVEGYGTILPWAQVINTGESMEPYVPLVVKADSSGYTVYSDMVTLYNVEILEIDTASFSPFTPAQGVYELCFHTELSGDVFPQDDTGKVTIYAQKTFYISPFRSIEPTIDGIIEENEWSDAEKIDISRIGDFTPWRDNEPWPYMPLGSAFMYAKQDSQNLFLAFDIPADANDTKYDYIYMYFDDNHSGEYETDSSEGGLYFWNSLADTMDIIRFRSFLPNNQYADTSFLVDSLDIRRGFANNNGNQQAEIKIPFGTDEYWHINTSINDTLALFPRYRDRSDSIYVPEWGAWMHRLIGWWPIDAFMWQPVRFGEIVLSPDTNCIAEQRIATYGVALEVLPNPCNRNLTVCFILNTSDNVDINLYDILGRKVAVLLNRQMSPQFHSMTFDLASLPNGIYFLRLETESTSITKKVTLIK